MEERTKDLGPKKATPAYKFTYKDKQPYVPQYQILEFQILK